MSFAVATRIARRELRGGFAGFRVFLTCLILGVAAIAGVGSVREAIQAGLQREGAVILGGDAQLVFTYRYADEAERAWMRENSTEVSELVDFRSMAVFGQGADAVRGLTQVKAVDNAYPLLGQVQLEPEISLDQALDGEGTLPGAAMDPVLISRLGMDLGDRFKLGEQEFILMASLLREPDNTGARFTLGPRTIVRTEALEESGLIQPGTLFETQYRMLLSDGVDLKALASEAAHEIDGARWIDRRDGAHGVQVFVDRLGSFLVLVGLAGLAVGGVGISAAVSAYLQRKTSVIATLKTIGADNCTIFLTYFLQIGALTILGLILGLTLGGLVPILLADLMQASLPVPAIFSLYPMALAEAAIYGSIAALIFTLWPLARVERVRAATLFRDVAASEVHWPRLLWIVVTLILLAALVALAGWFTGLWRLTLGAALGVVAAFVVLLIAAAAAKRLSRRLGRTSFLRGRTGLRLALGAVGGPGGEATSVVLSLGLGLSVLAAVGQIDSNLRGAIERDLPDVAPSFFMVDIQPDQMPQFTSMLEADEAVTKINSAPMLRGIITEINGQPVEEVAGDHWVLSGDRGVTYSSVPPEGTVVTEGEWWASDYSGDPLVSFAAEEAEELGIGVGDEITVNILGRDITARIVNLREVDFSTAGIGFIMSMNPGALAGAPHSFIATVYSDANADARILRETAGIFPNITAIRVKDAIDRVAEVLAGIATAITYGALAALITGGVVLIGAAAAGSHARTYEAAVLKTLGASRRTILISFVLRSAILGLAAGGVAIIAGSLAGWAIMWFVMETDYSFEAASALLIILGGVSATVLAGLLFAWGSLSSRPARILRARE